MIWRFIKGFFVAYEASEEERKKYSELAQANSLRTDVNALTIDRALASSESQAATVLTHVSIMIGVTGVLLATGPEAEKYELFLAAELIGYLFLALLCIRCQLAGDAFLLKRAKKNYLPGTNVSTNQLADDMNKLASDELQFRARLLQFCIYSIYALTCALMMTVIFGVHIGQFGQFEFGQLETIRK